MIPEIPSRSSTLSEPPLNFSINHRHFASGYLHTSWQPPATFDSLQFKRLLPYGSIAPGCGMKTYFSSDCNVSSEDITNGNIGAPISPLPILPLTVTVGIYATRCTYVHFFIASAPFTSVHHVCYTFLSSPPPPSPRRDVCVVSTNKALSPLLHARRVGIAIRISTPAPRQRSSNVFCSSIHQVSNSGNQTSLG